MSDTDLSEVIEEFGLHEQPKESAIPKEKVLSWMNSDDPEVLGALYSFVTEPRQAARVTPPLTFDEYWNFVSRYFSRCFRENPNGEWAHSRYEAGWDLASWFTSVWKDDAIAGDAKNDIKKWIGDQYVSGSPDLRRCIVDATLEHIFEDTSVARFFDDWRSDQILSTAYREAAQWNEETKQSGTKKE